MPRGVPLTPEQLAEIAAKFAVRGNAADVAREMGLDPSTVTRALGRIPEHERAFLHARAITRGLRIGRRHLVRITDKLGRELLSQLRAGSMEPQHAAQLTSALTSAARELVRMDLLEQKRLQGRLTRKRTRVEIAHLHAQITKLTQSETPTGTGEVRVTFVCEAAPAGSAGDGGTGRT